MQNSPVGRCAGEFFVCMRPGKFSILVRTLLKRASFSSVEDLRQRIYEVHPLLQPHWLSRSNGHTLVVL